MTIPVKSLAPLLQVFDMPAAIAFYRDVLGFEVVGSSSPGDDVDWVLLKLEHVELMLCRKLICLVANSSRFERTRLTVALNRERAICAHLRTGIRTSIGRSWRQGLRQSSCPGASQRRALPAKPHGNNRPGVFAP